MNFVYKGKRLASRSSSIGSTSTFDDRLKLDDFINVSAANPNVISGYLLKKTTEGTWQKRYFETNENFLVYYQSRKMSKLLAALNIAELSDITLVCNILELLVVLIDAVVGNWERFAWRMCFVSH